MSVHKKEHATPEANHRISKLPIPDLPTPEAFHQYLRAQIREATRVVIEEIMREELMLFLLKRGGSAPCLPTTAYCISTASTLRFDTALR